MSSTVPSRPIGWRATKSLRACTGSAKALMRPCSDGVSTVPGRSRCSGCLADVVGGDRLGEADHRRLARAVDEAVRQSADRGSDRGHVDDRAAALLQHPRQEGARHEVHRLHVHRERLVPVLGRSVEDRAVVHDSCAVEQHVDVADFACLSSNGRFVRDVQNARPDAVLALELPDGLGIHVARPDLRALAREGKRAARPMPWPAAVMNAVLPARRPAMEGGDYTSRSDEQTRFRGPKRDRHRRRARHRRRDRQAPPGLRRQGAIWDLDASPRSTFPIPPRLTTALGELGKSTSWSTTPASRA